MTIRPRHLARRLARFGVPASLFIVLLGATACRTLTGFAVEQTVEALTGQDVEVNDRGDEYDVLVDGVPNELPEDAARNVYLQGPARGWERGLRATASAEGSPYFLHRFSNDGCPTIDLGEGGRLFGGAPLDPFGATERPDGSGLLDGNTLDIDDRYVPVGRVPLGGTGSESRLWSPPSLFGMAGGPCAFPGLALLSFGPRTDDPVILR